MERWSKCELSGVERRKWLARESARKRYQKLRAADLVKLAASQARQAAIEANKLLTAEERRERENAKRRRRSANPIVREKSRARHRLERLRKRAIIDAVKELGLLDLASVYKKIGLLSIVEEK